MRHGNGESEQLELEAVTAIHDSVSSAVRRSLGLSLEAVDGFLCSASPVEPSILLNRCFVTDEGALHDVSAIRAVKQFYKALGVDRFFMHVVDNNPGRTAALEEAGMGKARGWMKFVRGTEPAMARDPGLDIRSVGPEHAMDFARIVTPCFDLSEAAIPLIVSMFDCPDWYFYMGFVDDEPAATGALYFRDGAAHCDWGSTHSDYRRRGLQGALLARRINEAVAMGAGSVYTETGESVAGDPQHSYSNILRYGFREDYLRENWVPV